MSLPLFVPFCENGIITQLCDKKKAKQTSMHVHNYSIRLQCWSNGVVYYVITSKMLCRIVLHDLFVDVIKAYILFLISILHVSKPRDTNM